MPVRHATVRLILRKDRPKPDGTCPVLLRVTANRKKRYTTTGITVKPSDWNENKDRVRAKHPIAPALNARLGEIEAAAKTAALRATSAEAVKAAVGASAGSLSAYFDAFIDGLDADGRFWDWKKYKTTRAHLHDALGEPLSWGEVDREALVRFERHLRKGKKLGANTVRKELSRLRRVYKVAVRDGVVRPSDDPFLVYEMPKGKAVHRRKLSLDEVRALEAAELEPGSVTELARDVFVFSFYVGGMRFSDVCTLRRDAVRDGRVQYQMMKTEAPVAVPAPPPALAVLEKYDGRGDGPLAFPLIEAAALDDEVRVRRRVNSRNVAVNAALKRAAKVAEVDPEGLTFHVARHTYADYARSKSGDLYAISKTLGHQNLKTTEVYLRLLDQTAVDRLGDDLWG